MMASNGDKGYAHIKALGELKKKQTSALCAISKKRTHLRCLMTSESNLHLVKSEQEVYQDLVRTYSDAHKAYTEALTIKEERDRISTTFRQSMSEAADFGHVVADWVVRVEVNNNYSDEIRAGDSSSNVASSRVSRSSKRSTATVLSVRAVERAKLAALLVEEKQMEQQILLMEKQMENHRRAESLKVEQRQLQLKLEIDKAKAREQVYTAEIGADEEAEPGRNNNLASETGLHYDLIPKVSGSVHMPSSPVVNETFTYDSASVDASYSGITRPPYQPSSYQTAATSKDRPPGDHFVDQPTKGSRLSPYAAEYHPRAQPVMINHSSQLNQQQSLCELVSAMTLPQPEVPKFSGNCMEYNRFIMSFDSRIASRTFNDADRLYFLDQQLQDDARDLVGGCLYMHPTEGYQEARRLLDKEYGDPFKISTAYISQVLAWPVIQQDDSAELKRLSIFLIRCLNVMHSISHLDVLHHMPNLQAIVQKLPGYVQSKWREVVNRIRRTHQRMPTFEDLVSFVESCAETANDPVFGKAALESHCRQAKESSNVKMKIASRESSFLLSASPLNDHTKQRDASNEEQRCHFCSKYHDIEECPDFLRKSVDERRTFLRENQRCFACFDRNHVSKGCMKRRTCKTCKRSHPTTLHEDNFRLRKAEDAKSADGTKALVSSACLATNENSSVVFHSILPVKVFQKNRGRSVITYAFLDSGSSGCFLTEELKTSLEADSEETSLLLRTMHGQSILKSDVVTGLTVLSLDGENPIELPRCFTRDEIPIDQAQIPKADLLRKWSHLNEVIDELPPYLPNIDIGLLIGINCPRALQPIKVVPSAGNGPFAALYPHGWTVNGPIRIDLSSGGTPVAVACSRINVEEVKFKEILNPSAVLRMFDTDFPDLYLQDSPGKQGNSREDVTFIEKVTREIALKDSHYVLPLPFRAGEVSMPCNKTQVLKRAMYLRRKLLGNELYRKDYEGFVSNLILMNFAERVPEGQLERSGGCVWYLPHHGVYHPKKPDKLRVVFDCAAKYDGVSLNDKLLQGPNLTNSLTGVLVRFREGPVAFTGDIQAMFHQVQVASEHRDFLRFFWWPDGDLSRDPCEYRMTVHLFGATSSPSIANCALRKTADQAEADKRLEAASTIRRNFYVDDCLKSTNTEKEAEDLIQELRISCKKGGFKLTKFSSNRMNVVESIAPEERSKELQTRVLDHDALPTELTLGVHWSLSGDTFGFHTQIKDKPLTRRGILSMTSSLYDPLGFVAPFVLLAKKILQDLCKENHLGWDDPVPEGYEQRWSAWLSSLPLLEHIHVKRCIRPEVFSAIKSRDLHVFSDASFMGYGAVAYLRVVDVHGRIHCAFLMGKARLSPAKQTTIPRLELTAATVAVRVGKMLEEEMECAPNKTMYHTDSTTVLRYIFSEKRRFPTFVANRVQFILDHTQTRQWRYVDTKSNPADHASRGIDIKDLSKSQWLEGPQFLWREEAHWPAQVIPATPEDQENKVIAAATSIETTSIDEEDETPNPTDALLHYYSDWCKLKMAVAVYRAWIDVIRYKTCHRRRAPAQLVTISVEALKASECSILRYVQRQNFSREISALSEQYTDKQARKVTRNSSVYKLDPFLENGLLRVGGRLKRAAIPDESKFPVLLPCKGHVTTIIIRHIHARLGHSGRNHVMASLREQFWVIHANSSVRRVISACVSCRRFRSPPAEQKMADLPTERCATEPPFTYSGVDFFGPFVLRQGRKDIKRYGALFTCLSSRAVHIEVAASLDVSSFIHALRRFIARRGTVRQLRCDNGSNFVGTEKQLQKCLEEMNDGQLKNLLLKQSIEWIFNPPTASHMGGIWERQIRTVRKLLSALSREFGDKLDEESFTTLMCEIESVINSRPLTVMSSDPDDDQPLTPNHILTMKTSISLPPPGEFQSADIYMRKRWRRVQYMTNVFWSRWKREYLSNLQVRQKWNGPKRNMTVGDVVLLKDDSLPRNCWSMGRILTVEADGEGFVRSVTLKTSTSELRRPVSKIILLVPTEEQRT